MDYEKAYKDALERARQAKNGEGDWRYYDPYEIIPALEEIFPELRESEEQPTKGYDESCLNKCIAKASKTWENVDVDKYMDEVRGREQEQPKGAKFEEELESYLQGWEDDEELGLVFTTDEGVTQIELGDIKDLARHFAEWGENRCPLPEDTVLFNKGVEEGKRLMMEYAVDVQVVGEQRDLRLIDNTQRCLFDAIRGDWLEIIICKKEENDG